jgi:hypothetical protein
MIKIKHVDSSEITIMPGQVLANGEDAILVIHDSHGYNAVRLEGDGVVPTFGLIYSMPVSISEIKEEFPIIINSELNLTYGGRL